MALQSLSNNVIAKILRGLPVGDRIRVGSASKDLRRVSEPSVAKWSRAKSEKKAMRSQRKKPDTGENNLKIK